MKLTFDKIMDMKREKKIACRQHLLYTIYIINDLVAKIDATLFDKRCVHIIEYHDGKQKYEQEQCFRCM